jgi:hypothetical protein
MLAEDLGDKDALNKRDYPALMKFYTSKLKMLLAV